ncbi:MAG: YkvI family membrane protein [Oceanisphaera sp.]|uniref:YkvI family membrane protein n=1 Tax=Oceanisphaera sp. TaxID=1929979 RepID=UPI003F9C749F
MWKVLQISSAFVGIIVGAGFASGQEVLQYFTSFGHLGTAAAVVATALFAYLGMMLTMLGSRTGAQSHKTVIYQISGRYLGVVVDYVIIFTLFGVGVVMIAGAGSILDQQFGFAPYIGSIIMTLLMGATLMLKVDKVVGLIGSITPFLILALALICGYSLLTMDRTFAELAPIAENVTSTLPHWFVSAVNYVSFNIAVGAAMSLVMGGAEKNESIAKWGGLLGGAGIGVLIMISHLAMFSQIDNIVGFPLPLLKIIDGISPWLATAMSFVLFGMIFSTGASMFYAFVARFVVMRTPVGNGFSVATLVVGFIASFAGFTKLVAFFYPLIGYLGLFLVFALIVAPFKLKRDARLAQE